MQFFHSLHFHTDSISEKHNYIGVFIFLKTIVRKEKYLTNEETQLPSIKCNTLLKFLAISNINNFVVNSFFLCLI